jgi:hypothetical protein
MANITISIPAARILLIAARHGYEDNIPNPNFDEEQPISAENPTHIPNIITKQQFVKKVLVDIVKRECREKILSDYANTIENDLDDIS